MAYLIFSRWSVFVSSVSHVCNTGMSSPFQSCRIIFVAVMKAYDIKLFWTRCRPFVSLEIPKVISVGRGSVWTFGALHTKSPEASDRLQNDCIFHKGLSDPDTFYEVSLLSSGACVQFCTESGNDGHLWKRCLYRVQPSAKCHQIKRSLNFPFPLFFSWNHGRGTHRW